MREFANGFFIRFASGNDVSDLELPDLLVSFGFLRGRYLVIIALPQRVRTNSRLRSHIQVFFMGKCYV